MGIRTLPFFKGKKGFQMAGGGYTGDGGGGSYVLPTASSSTLGGVKIGSNISIDAGGAISAPDSLEEKDTLPTASADELGNRYIYTGETGGGLTKGYVYECVSDGQDPQTYSWAPSNVQSPYTLPTASASTLGGVMIGGDLSITDGVLSVSSSSGTTNINNLTWDRYGNIVKVTCMGAVIQELTAITGLPIPKNEAYVYQPLVTSGGILTDGNLIVYDGSWKIAGEANVSLYGSFCYIA